MVPVDEAEVVAYSVAVLLLQSTQEVMMVLMALMSRSLTGDKYRWGRWSSSRKAEASLHATRFTAD